MNLDAYFKRIEYSGPVSPTIETLNALHFAHACHIPFENLDVLLGRAIKLDLVSLETKLIHNQRGGYCFEQNALFAVVLESLGFSVKRLAGRVRMGANTQRPRTHMMLDVTADDSHWLCDVGFGGEGLLHPHLMQLYTPMEQHGWTYRLIEEDASMVLQSLHKEGWTDLYSFTTDEQFSIDYEMANYFTSTYPDSHFKYFLIVQRPGPGPRLRLVNRILTEQTPESISETQLDDDSILRVLAERFGLPFPAGTRFPFDENRFEKKA